MNGEDLLSGAEYRKEGVATMVESHEGISVTGHLIGPGKTGGRVSE